MDTSQQQVVERLKEATNVLITTSSNPSVDQLAAVIGFTLLLNKMDKHATAVFSGAVPSTIEFLQPEKTLEKTTDSLRDFIIAIDKSKADKLRYKVEDSHVKIFITPYRTSISEKDLEFSQGDFNVDLVVLLGIHDQKDLDQAITAHGRILHDATVVSIANTAGDNLGSVNWVNPKASSLCEMLVTVGEQVKADAMDAQIATALMTGIVAETERFSNEKTSASTMAVSAKLMAAGANQQLVATELQPKPAPPPPAPEPPAAPEPADQPGTEAAAAEQPAEQPAAPPPPADGALRIDHTAEDQAKQEGASTVALEPEETAEEDKLEQIHIDEDGSLHPIAEMEEKPKPAPAEPPIGELPSPSASAIVTAPPALGGTLTANTEPETTDENPLSLPPIGGGRILSHDAPIGNSAPVTTPSYLPTPSEPAEPEEPQQEEPVRRTDDHGHITIQPPSHHDTPITELARQEEGGLPELPQPSALPGLPGQDSGQAGLPEPPVPVVGPSAPLTEESARDAVSDAVNALPNQTLPPPAAFNAQPLDLDVQAHPDAPVVNSEPVPSPTDGPTDFSLPPNLVPPQPEPPVDNTASPVTDPSAPPPVPPPMMPPMPGFVQPPLGSPQDLPSVADDPGSVHQPPQ